MAHPDAAFPVAREDVWIMEAFLMTDSPGKELRLILVLLDGAGSPVGQRHLKFSSTASMRRFTGTVRIPVDAARGQVLVGMHDTGTLWIDYVSARSRTPHAAGLTHRASPVLQGADPKRKGGATTPGHTPTGGYGLQPVKGLRTSTPE